MAGGVRGGRERQSRFGGGEQQGLTAVVTGGLLRAASAQPLGEFALPAAPAAEVRAHLSPRLAVVRSSMPYGPTVVRIGGPEHVITAGGTRVTAPGAS